MSAGTSSARASVGEQHYHAFLSHNGADKSWIEILANELERRGISCWLDIWNLIPGDPWQPAIEQALCQCDTCVVFFGPHGLGPWHNEEMRLALQRRVNSQERKLRVLPVILPGSQRAKEGDLPGLLQGTTWVEFRQSIDDEDALDRLECGIRGTAPRRRPDAMIQLGECPYVGLKTFQPEDARLFFGRAAKVQELIDRLRHNFGSPQEERFLALIGASGSGKSSLALAGLIPALQRGELPESGQWPLIRCRPGARSWESLQIALANNRQVAPYLTELPALITRPEDEQRRLHLTARLALHDQPETYRLFVLVDQFEEIFTLSNDEKERCQLIDNLLYASNVTEGRTIVVLTIRADFYGQCATYPGLRAAIADHQSLIGPLSDEEIREVIQTPAQRAGGELEPGLIELLLADMRGQVGALPFLEHALFKLWEKRDGRRLTAKVYLDMGRLGGALNAHAEEFFTRTLTTEEQSLCRQVLVDLIRPGEGVSDTKKRASLDDLAPTDAARAVVKKLADARLVTTDREDRPEAAQAELAHEALISGWRRLGQWVNENREKSRLKERLLDAGGEWERSGKKEDFLYRGIQLATAEENFGSSAESLPKLAREFLAASGATRDRERHERQREQRNRQRLLVTALAVFALLLVAVCATLSFGLLNARKAEEQAKRAANAAYWAVHPAAEQQSSGAVYQPGVPLDRLVCFLVGNNGHVHVKFLNGQQSVWEDQGLPPGTTSVFPPNAVYHPTLDRLYCFLVGNNGHVHVKFLNGQQSVWENQGLPPGTNAISSPSAIYQTWPDRLHCFVVGNDGHLYDNFLTGQQWVWQDQGLPGDATAVSSPCAVYQATLDRLVCFVVGNNGHLYDHYWNDQQSVWDYQGLPRGTTAVSSPGAVYQSAFNRLVCFVVGNNGHLYENFWSGQGWVWEDPGLPSGITAVSSPKVLYETPHERTHQRLHCFSVGNNGHLYDCSSSGQQWDWKDQGLPPGTTAVSLVGAVYQLSRERLICFVVGNNGRLYDKFWAGLQSAWEDQGSF